MLPLVPPLALGVIVLVGTAVLIGVGDGVKTQTAEPQPPQQPPPTSS